MYQVILLFALNESRLFFLESAKFFALLAGRVGHRLHEGSEVLVAFIYPGSCMSCFSQVGWLQLILRHGTFYSRLNSQVQ